MKAVLWTSALGPAQSDFMFVSTNHSLIVLFHSISCHQTMRVTHISMWLTLNQSRGLTSQGTQPLKGWKLELNPLLQPTPRGQQTSYHPVFICHLWSLLRVEWCHNIEELCFKRNIPSSRGLKLVVHQLVMHLANTDNKTPHSSHTFFKTVLWPHWSHWRAR